MVSLIEAIASKSFKAENVDLDRPYNDTEIVYLDDVKELIETCLALKHWDEESAIYCQMCGWMNFDTKTMTSKNCKCKKDGKR